MIDSKSLEYFLSLDAGSQEKLMEKAIENCLEPKGLVGAQGP